MLTSTETSVEKPTVEALHTLATQLGWKRTCKRGYKIFYKQPNDETAFIVDGAEEVTCSVGFWFLWQQRASIRSTQTT